MIGQCEEKAYAEKAYAEKAYAERPAMHGYAREIGRVDTPRNGIAGELQTLRELTNAAHEYVTMIEQKTAAFRRISPQCEAKEEKIPRQYGSELTEELAAQNARLSTLCNRMSSIIEEIDL